MSRLRSYQFKIMMMAVIPLLVLFVFINGIYFFAIDEIAVREKKHEISSTLDSYQHSLEVFFEEIQHKTEPLTPEETAIFQKHPQVGYFILKEIDRLKRVAEIVLEHHEWVNGQGYPRGISGDDIKIEAKILAICESYDAQSQSRPYRPVPLTYAQAKASMMAQRGIRFDADLLDLFFTLLEQGTQKGRS